MIQGKFVVALQPGVSVEGDGYPIPEIIIINGQFLLLRGTLKVLRNNIVHLGTLPPDLRFKSKRRVCIGWVEPSLGATRLDILADGKIMLQSPLPKGSRLNLGGIIFPLSDEAPSLALLNGTTSEGKEYARAEFASLGSGLIVLSGHVFGTEQLAVDFAQLPEGRRPLGLGALLGMSNTGVTYPILVHPDGRVVAPLSRTLPIQWLGFNGGIMVTHPNPQQLPLSLNRPAVPSGDYLFPAVRPVPGTGGTKVFALTGSLQLPIKALLSPATGEPASPLLTLPREMRPSSSHIFPALGQILAKDNQQIIGALTVAIHIKPDGTICLAPLKTAQIPKSDSKAQLKNLNQSVGAVVVSLNNVIFTTS